MWSQVPAGHSQGWQLILQLIATTMHRHPSSQDVLLVSKGCGAGLEGPFPPTRP